MVKKEMEKLLFYDNGKIMIEGYDLVDIANMYHLSIDTFLTLFQIYLQKNKRKLNNNYSISIGKEGIYTAETMANIKWQRTGEILVLSDQYETMKKKAFDFAYTKCSRLGDTNFSKFGLEDVDSTTLSKTISKLEVTYSCIYRSVNGGWSQKISDIKIDEEDQMKRYALIKR